ncbi:sigma-E processing peptidase SpoIIGA [Actinomycetes bacterium NPDC127524]
MALYLDVIWLLNWFFDCLLLYWSAVLLKKRPAPWRIGLGGLIGSLIIILAFTPFHLLADKVYMKLLFSVFMVLAVFGFNRFNVMLKALMTLYLVTFLSGGILLGLHYFFQSHILAMHPERYQGINRFGDPMSWMFVVFGFPIAWQFSKRAIGNIEMTQIAYEQMAEVSIKIKDFHCSLKGFIDSGNQLYDPISRAPVMIVSLTDLESRLPADMLELFRNPQAFLEHQAPISYSWEDRIKIIPAKVVGKDHQLLIAVKPDEIKIFQGDKTFQYKNGLVSFAFQELSSDGSYQCIIHPKMLTGVPIQNVS